MFWVVLTIFFKWRLVVGSVIVCPAACVLLKQHAQTNQHLILSYAGI